MFKSTITVWKSTWRNSENLEVKPRAFHTKELCVLRKVRASRVYIYIYIYLFLSGKQLYF